MYNIRSSRPRSLPGSVCRPAAPPKSKRLAGVSTVPCFYCVVVSVAVLRHTYLGVVQLPHVLYGPSVRVDEHHPPCNCICVCGWVVLFTPSHQTGFLSRLGSCLHLASPTSITVGPWSVCSISAGTSIKSPIVMTSNSFSHCIVFNVAPVIGRGALVLARSGCDLSPHSSSPFRLIANPALLRYSVALVPQHVVHRPQC